MLLVTSLVFLVSWVPYWLYMASILARLLGTEISEQTNFALEKCAYIIYINNAVNPVIYSLANRRFREDCKGVFKNFRRR